MYILSFDRNFCAGIKGIMDSGRRQMTAPAKLTEAVEHAYKKRNENKYAYVEALTEIGSCNIRQTVKNQNFVLLMLTSTKSTCRCHNACRAPKNRIFQFLYYCLAFTTAQTETVKLQ
jgi:hypothetical protein